MFKLLLYVYLDRHICSCQTTVSALHKLLPCVIIAAGVDRFETEENLTYNSSGGAAHLCGADGPTAIFVTSPTDSPSGDTAAEPAEPDSVQIHEDGAYTTKEDVALYIHTYGCLPSNFVTKDEAKQAGWEGGSLEKYLPGKCIGGDRFRNREGLLPDAPGRTWTECDINTLGASSRGAERIVFSNDGLIYYTGDHYDSFELLYG